MSIDLANNQHAYPFIIGNVKIPFFYQPYYNPNKVTFTSKKAYNRTQTIGGNVFEAWGKDPVVIHVEMTIKKQDFLGDFIGVYKDLGVEDPLVCSELLVLQRLFEFDQRKLKSIKQTKTELLNTTDSLYAKGAKSTSKLTQLSSKLGALGLGFVDVGVATADLVSEKTTSSSVSNFLIENVADTIIYYKTNIYTGFFTDFYYEEDGKNPFINRVTFNFTVTSSIADTLNNWLATDTAGRSVLGVLGAASAITTTSTFIDKAASGISSFVSNLGRL